MHDSQRRDRRGSKNPNGKILERELRDRYSDLPADLDEAKG